MLIGIEARPRNGEMLKWRKERGFNQKQAAQAAGVSHSGWCAAEVLRFKDIGFTELSKIADTIGMSIESIFPPECRKKNLAITRCYYREYEVGQLVAANRAAERLMLPASVDLASENLDKQSLAKALDRAMSSLTDNERAVLNLRFGTKDGTEHTLVETGNMLGLTRERVRQIEAKAIRKMQEGPRAKKLAEFVEEP